jgi:hypothetical protein
VKSLVMLKGGVKKDEGLCARVWNAYKVSGNAFMRTEIRFGMPSRMSRTETLGNLRTMKCKELNMSCTN